MTPIEQIEKALGQWGSEMYGTEAVTQLQHDLQTATFTEEAGATPTLIAAALLHDYGHFLNDDDAIAAQKGIDLAHEEVAGDYLQRWFGPEITEPVRLHVPAKRYLCAVEPGYFSGLSPASVLSLQVQGGIYTKDEASDFIARPFAEDAANLRRWDDMGKDPDKITPDLAYFLGFVESQLNAQIRNNSGAS